MGATPSHQLQEAEFELVLRSGLFAKSPRLERFFRYICERHLEGECEQIKEYSVALEALGRPSEFDPKKDSIVRVEAHRLRKRLDEYYQGPGAGHAVRISIPNGQYRPHFVAVEARPAPLPEAALEEHARPDMGTAAAPARVRRWLRPVLLAAGGCCLLAAFGALVAIHSKSVAAQPVPPEVWHGNPNALANLSEVRILAGYHGPTILDRQGHSWMEDAFYQGGVSSALPADRLADAQFLRAQRTGRFAYAIPLRQTTYEMHLYMMETEYGRGNPKGGGESTRAFQISVNGSVKVKFLDPLAAAGGPNRLYERVVKDITPGADGVLRLAFDPLTGPALLNAFEILPSSKGRIHPIRIVAQQGPITDSEGRIWAADEFFLGGMSVCRTSVVAGKENALCHGERYGNFSYRIPVAPGKYRLTLHFAETWFGTPQSDQPALGSRIFNVFANGVALLRNYQVAQDAGGANKEVVKVFDNLEPDAQGLLVIDFVPVENYAEVNALEVVETG